jgi:hypothetical protein
MVLTSATVYQQKDHNNEDRYNNQPDNDIRQEFRWSSASLRFHRLVVGLSGHNRRRRRCLQRTRA